MLGEDGHMGEVKTKLQRYLIGEVQVIMLNRFLVRAM